MTKTTLTTERNGYPCSIILTDPHIMEKLALAYRAGVKVVMTYTDLSGITHTRDCFIETMHSVLGMVTIKGRDFGYRTVCVERIAAC